MKFQDDPERTGADWEYYGLLLLAVEAKITDLEKLAALFLQQNESTNLAFVENRILEYKGALTRLRREMDQEG